MTAFACMQKEDKGKYTCKVANDYGITAWDAWLSVSSKCNFCLQAKLRTRAFNLAHT